MKQGHLGDCYLIAAIASVVQSDPGHFIKNMTDNLDGTVTVKLYEDDGSPVNIVINKSSVSNGYTRDQYAKGLLWVQMLEKAYAAAGFTGKRELPNRMGASYEGIAGGAGDVALAHLTGKATKSYNIGTRRQSVAEKIVKRLAATVNALKVEYRLADEVLAKLREAGLRSSDKYKDTVKEQDAIYAKIEGIQGPIGKLGGILSLNYVSNKSLTTFLTESNGPPELGQALFDETHPSGQPLLPGELGSNEYGADEVELYQKIKAGLDGGQAVTVSSKTSIVDAENEEEATKGFSAGETMASGLVGKHEYSVLDYLPKKLEPGVPLKAHIRNPWGSYGRKYVQRGSDTKGVADKAGTGAFWIDMADMVSFFQTLSYTAPRPPVLPPTPRLLAPIPVPSDAAKKEIIRGKFYADSVQDLYRAIIEIAEDRGAEDFAADLVTAYKTHSPFVSKAAMIDRFVAVIGGKQNVAESIAEYLLDNTE